MLVVAVSSDYSFVLFACVNLNYRLPYTLGSLPNLKAIVLDGNPMKSIRRDIIMVG